jgi:hypothetical protein
VTGRVFYSPQDFFNWITAFKEVLIPDLDEADFSDMFAQTLAYGLFAARVHSLDSGQPFSREMAAYNLPRTNPFLRTAWVFSAPRAESLPTSTAGKQGHWRQLLRCSSRAQSQ